MLRLCICLERQSHDGKTENGPAGEVVGWNGGEGGEMEGGDSVCVCMYDYARVRTHICIYSIVAASVYLYETLRLFSITNGGWG